MTQQCSRQGAHFHQSVKGFVPPAAGAGNPPMTDADDTIAFFSGTNPDIHHDVEDKAWKADASAPTYSANRTRTPELVGTARTSQMTTETDTELLQTPATGTMATEPGSHPSAPEHLQSSRYPDSTHLPQSYAQITKNTRQSSNTTTSPPSPSSPSETTRLNKTQILRRLPYDTTPRTIINDISRQLEIPEKHLLERVIRDPRDRRRFYVTYKTAELKTYATRQGFYIGQTYIKPTDGTTTGYIPFPPYYIDATTLDRLLGHYGTDVVGDFVRTAQNTIIAGYKFSMNIKSTMAQPKTLEYNGYTMDVKYDDDVRQCRYCGRYGHLIGKCRTKAADDELHQRRRNDHAKQLTESWKEERLAMLAIKRMEKKKLHHQMRDELTATSDVFQSTLITMEADGGSQAAFDNLTIAYEKDQDDLMEQYRDTIEYHSEEFSDKLSAIDAKFHAIGAIPPSMEFDTDDSGETTPRRPRTSSGCESVTMVDVQHAETRLSNKLRELDRDRPEESSEKDHAASATPAPVATPAITPPVFSAPLLQQQRPTPATTTTAPTHQFHLLPPVQQSKIVAICKQQLPPSYNYRSHCKYIIQVKTPTPHITSIIRTHLFTAKMRPGYEYLNPMETEICTADQDETSRMIYIKDLTTADHIMSYLRRCRDDRTIVFIADPVQLENAHFDPDTER